jgi:SAM-dependent methyltransferase
MPGKRAGGAAAWNANAAAWSQWVGGDAHRRVLLDPVAERLLRPLRGRDVVDLGCGEGRFSRLLAARGARVLGVDFSPALVARARRASRGRGNPRYAAGDMTRLRGVPDAAFDRVVAYLSLVNLPSLHPAVAEAARVLRPGGRLVAVVSHPCFSTPEGGWEAELPVVPRGAPRVRRLFVARYFGAGRERFRFAPGFPAATTNYHHTLGEYVDALARAGLRLRRWVEPRPSAALARRDPTWEPYRRVPLFAVWAAEKMS